MKRFLSALLVVVMFFSMFSTINATVYASSSIPVIEVQEPESSSDSTKEEKDPCEDIPVIEVQEPESSSDPTEEEKDPCEDIPVIEVQEPESSPNPTEGGKNNSGDIPVIEVQDSENSSNSTKEEKDPCEDSNDSTKTNKEDVFDPCYTPENTEVTTSNESTCNHRLKDYFSEDDCKKYDVESHEWTGTYKTKCRKCNKVLEVSKGKKKELHNFEDGECEDCGYKAKNCEHEETEKIVTYWYNDVNERGNDASYVEYDIVCAYCDIKVDTAVHYGPVTAIEASSKCDHDEVEEKVVSTYYEPSTEEAHYKLTKYIVECLECKEEFNSYTEEREYKHEIVDGKCTNCIYQTQKVSATSTSKATVSDAKSSNTNSGSTSNINSKINSNTTNSKTTANTKTTTNTKVTVNEETFEKVEVGSTEKVESSEKVSTNAGTTEPVEVLYLSAGNEIYTVNGEAIAWQCTPQENEGVLQVPLREFAEAMGWSVTWDSEKSIAYVDNGKINKIFVPDLDVYSTDATGSEEWKFLSNESKIINGVLYADLEGLLEDTEYSYYKNDTMYFVKGRDEVLKRISRDRISGNNQLTTAQSINNEIDSISANVDECIYAFEQNGDSLYYTVIKPMADQAVYGNYYEGETTKDGVICRIIVGELPGVGTAADIRDIVADFQNWEWSWSHAGNTLLDIVGIVPLVGSLKYADELAMAAKNSDELAEVAKGIEKTTDVGKTAGNVADTTKNASNATGPVVKAEDLASSANKNGNVVELPKDAQKIADVAKANIKSVDDLKALTQNGSIYSSNFWDHVFYGDKSGGFHYTGLTGSNGTVKKITKAPNKYGVYEADVTILGKDKTKNTFFPDDWTPEEVVSAIEEAFVNGKYDADLNIRTYEMKSGMKIQVNLDRKTGQIVSAFPLY